MFTIPKECPPSNIKILYENKVRYEATVYSTVQEYVSTTSEDQIFIVSSTFPTISGGQVYHLKGSRGLAQRRCQSYIIVKTASISSYTCRSDSVLKQLPTHII